MTPSITRHDEIIAKLEQRVEELENKYRKALWLGHGCEGVYGDDGEMQCNDMILHGKSLDFKRMPLEELEEAVFIGKVKIYQRIWELEAELKRIQEFPTVEGAKFTADMTMCLAALAKYDQKLAKTGLAALDGYNLLETLRRTELAAERDRLLAGRETILEDAEAARTRVDELIVERDRLKEQYDTLARSLKYDKDRRTIVQKEQHGKR